MADTTETLVERLLESAALHDQGPFRRDIREEAAAKITSQAEQIAALTASDAAYEAELQHAEYCVETISAQRDAALAEIEALREALGPFAANAEMYDSCDQHSKGCPNNALAGELVDLTVGDFRRARAVLQSTTRSEKP